MIQTFSKSSSLSRMLAFLFASAACWSLALTMVSMHWWHFFSSSYRVKIWTRALKTTVKSSVLYRYTRLCFGLLYLICNSCDVSHALNVRRELVDFFHQVLHHFYMTLKKDIFQNIVIRYFSTKGQHQWHLVLAKMFINPMDSMTNLAERCHEGGYFAIVCCIHIGSSLHQQLHHIKVATVSSKPQRGVPLLVSHINVSPSTLTEQKQQCETKHSEVRTDYCTLLVLQKTHLLMRSSQNL